MTTIAAPATAYTVDTTGWELDVVAEQIRTVRFDLAQGNDRPLTADEIEALEDDTIGLPAGSMANPDDWWISDPQVGHAVEILGEIVDEAIFQRDLAAGMDRLGRGLDLTDAQRAAYDEYVAGL